MSDLPKLPLKEAVKWEKRSSERITKRNPTDGKQREGHQDSNDEEEESLPSVFEIKPPYFRQGEETSERKLPFLKTLLFTSYRI